MSTGGITLVNAVGLQTSENPGGDAKFRIVLTSRPTANVTIPLRSSDVGEGTVTPALLVFTPDNWASEQEVTIRGVDDDDLDGPAMYEIITDPAQSSDPNYNGKDADNAKVTNLDNDTANVQLLNATNLMTTEPNGMATFQVRLTTAPTADVTVSFMSSDTGEVSVAPASLTFTTGNWAAPQTVNLTGVDDTDVDGPVTVTIVTAATSAGDSRYNNIDVTDIQVINNDNETAAIVATPSMGLVTRENGERASFDVALNTAPTADVTVTLRTLDPAEATISGTLTFTPQNWNGGRTVWVTGINDTTTDGDKPFTLTLTAASSDSRFNGKVTNVKGTNLDDETPGVNVRPTAGLRALEGGVKATFTVSLNTKPVGSDVTIPIESLLPDQATVSPTSLTFTEANWRAARTVTVTAVDDALQDGAQPVVIDLKPAISDDENYKDRDPDNVTVLAIDNDSAGLLVTADDPILTDEKDDRDASFTIALTYRPTADVTIPLSSSNTNEITLDRQSVTFTSDNWQSAQTVTLHGVDDTVNDFDTWVDINLAPATSADLAYNGLNPVPRLRARNLDDDKPGVRVTPAGTVLVTDEARTKQPTFKLNLTYAPTADVVIVLETTNGQNGRQEAELTPTAVTFTPANWQVTREFTLTGIDDSEQDGLQNYAIRFASVHSSDPGYENLVVNDIPAQNEDNDSPGLVVTPAGPFQTTEGGPVVKFKVALATAPTADVTVDVASLSPDEGTASPARLTFTTSNWGSGQEVTVTGVPDMTADGNQDYFIHLGPSNGGTDSRWAEIEADVPFTSIDADQASFRLLGANGVALGSTILEVLESGTVDDRQKTFFVELAAKPTQEVRLTVSVPTTSNGEVRLSTQELVFLPTDLSTRKPVTVTSVGDLTQDGDKDIEVSFGPLTTTDPKYALATVPSPVMVTNVDTDGPGIRVSKTTLETGEAGRADTFNVRWFSPPTAAVTIPFELVQTTPEVVLTSAGLQTPPAPALARIVIPANAPISAPMAVTLTGVQDLVADGAKTFQIVFKPAESNDPNYAGRVLPLISGTNTDDDSPGITVLPAGLTVTEAGSNGTDQTTFQVVLTSQPSSATTVPITMDPTGQATLSRTTLNFDGTNWSNPQTVTITAVDDPFADGAQPVRFDVGPVVNANEYGGRSGTSFTVTVNDDDVADVIVVPFANPLPTNEDGTIAADGRFTIRLGSKPTQDVTVTPTFQRVGVAPFERVEGDLLVGPTITLRAADWPMTQQTIAVHGLDDALDDGPQAYVLTLTPTSGDPNYDEPSRTMASRPSLVETINVVNADDDTAAIEFVGSLPVPPTTTIPERGSRTVSVRIRSRPTAPVLIDIESANTAEATVDPAQISFGPDDYLDVKTFTVTGVRDDIDDVDVNVPITLSRGQSADAKYDNLPVTGGSNPFTVRIVDINQAFINVAPLELTTYEQGNSQTFTVVLATRPVAPVRVPITSQALGEVAVVPTELNFDDSNWNMPQTVTVTGVNDLVLTGDSNTNVMVGTGDTTDPKYQIPGSTVAVHNLEVGKSCNEFMALGLNSPVKANGLRRVDPDLWGTAFTEFSAWCDLQSAGGGWTLLSWSGDTTVAANGPPYPGFAPGAYNAVRGSGVPNLAAANAVIALSTELAQGQAVTPPNLKTPANLMTSRWFDRLDSYEFASAVVFPTPLADLTLSRETTLTCAPLREGRYHNISGAVPSGFVLDADSTADADSAVDTDSDTPIFVNQALHAGFPGNYSVDPGSYTWSVGNAVDYCETNGTPPGSFIGTWQATQYGPGQQVAVGSYSVWAR